MRPGLYPEDTVFGTPTYVPVPESALLFLQENLPVCDDFDSYTAGELLGDENDMFRQTFPAQGDLDFTVTGSGALGATDDTTAAFHTALFTTTWHDQTEDVFGVAIDFQIAKGASENEQIRFGITLGDFSQPGNFGFNANADCLVPGVCQLTEEWNGINGTSSNDNPITIPANYAETVFQMSLTVNMEGILTMTVNGESLAIATDESKTLPLELEVDFYSKFSDQTTSSIDNLAYTACGMTPSPTFSMAPTSAPVQDTGGQSDGGDGGCKGLICRVVPWK